MEKLKTVRISRRRWLRGTDKGTLRNSHGKQCCLGFVCREYGLKAKDIKGIDIPSSLSLILNPDLPEWLLESKDVNLAVEANDDVSLSDRQREKEIRVIFARNGLRAVFTK